MLALSEVKSKRLKRLGLAVYFVLRRPIRIFGASLLLPFTFYLLLFTYHVSTGSGRDIALELFYLEFLLLDLRFDQVADRKHADHRSAVYHRQVADPLFGH